MTHGTNTGGSGEHEENHSPAQGKRRRSIRRRPFLLASLTVAVLAAIAVAATAWIGMRAVSVRDELNGATKLIPQLKTAIQNDDPKAAAQIIDKLAVHTSGAKEATADPLWATAGALPWIGGNFRAVNDVAVSADEMAQLGARPLVGIYQSLDWESLLPNRKGVDLAPLTKVQPAVARAAASVRDAAERLDRIDAAGLLPQVSDPLIRARDELSTVSRGLSAAADFVGLAPDMLGGNGSRDYLLMIQNNAEARSTGGIPGALAKLTVDKGRLTLGSQTSAGALGKFSPPVAVDPNQELIYSNRMGTFMQDVNLTPDFPTAAKTAQMMWEKKTGERLDGVVSVDPVALSYILDATGPIALADPTLENLPTGRLPAQLNSKNVVTTLLSDVYAQIPLPAVQDLYFGGVASEIFRALSTGSADTKKLVAGISRGSDEGRMQVWSADAKEQEAISRYPLGGAISGSRTLGPEFGVYFNDGTGAKMDYYIKRTVQLVEECTAAGQPQTKVRVTSSNTAPPDAGTSLPAYVTGGGVFGVPAGTVQTNVNVYGPAQSDVEAVVRDGKKVSFNSQHHQDRPVGGVTIRVAPGQSTTLEVAFSKVRQVAEEPRVFVTPGVQPTASTILPTSASGCSVTAKRPD